MPRLPRQAAVETAYHVTARGNNGEAIFRDDYDRYTYLSLLAKIDRENNVTLYAYVLMTNHVHLALWTKEANLSAVIQRLHGTYAAYFNRKYGRRGHLFGGRFQSRIIDHQEYLLQVTAYLHLNPVRAGLVQRPEEYPWSSYRLYLNSEPRDTVVDIRSLLDLLHPDPGRGRMAYASYVNAWSREWSNTLRAAPSDQVQTVVGVVARYVNLSEGELRTSRSAAKARAIALYLLREVTTRSYKQLGALMNLKRSAVSNAVARIRRDLIQNGALRDQLDRIRREVSDGMMRFPYTPDHPGAK